MKLKEKHIDINKAMSICIRAGVRVYPVPIGRMFAIEVVNGPDKPKRYDKLVSSNDVAAAQRKTYIMYARSLIKDQLDA